MTQFRQQLLPNTPKVAPPADIQRRAPPPPPKPCLESHEEDWSRKVEHDAHTLFTVCDMSIVNRRFRV